MMRGKGFFVLAAITAAVAGGAFMTLDEQSQVPQAGQLLFPDALAKVNDVTQLDVISAGEKFSLQRNAEGVWIAPQREGFLANGNKVRKLVVGMANLQRLQPKTGKPERFKELGLRDPMLKDSRGVQFTLRQGADTRLAELIVGQSRPAKGDETRSEIFVRVPSEDKSWLVIGSIPGQIETIVDWLETKIISLADARIARSRITHSDGDIVTVQRDASSTQNFTYLELPQGGKATEVWRINDIARLLVKLDLYEVKSAKALPGNDASIEVSEFVTETFDGLRVHMKMFDIGDEPLVVLRAEYDESIIGGNTEAKPEAVRAEVEAFNKRWAPWAYVIPKYKGDAVRRRQKDMLEEQKPAAS